MLIEPPVTDQAWDAFVDAARPTSYLQRSAWAESKKPNGWRAVRILRTGRSDPSGDDGVAGGSVAGVELQVPGADPQVAGAEPADTNRRALGAQLLIRRVAPTPWSVAYAPRGPLASDWNEDTIASFSAMARDVLAMQPERIAYLRIDPGLDLASDPDALGRGSAWMAARLGEAGWRPAPAVQPNASRIVDLRVSEAELWSGLRKKWRQYVNRARTEGIRVVEGSTDRLADFYAIYRETARRAGFIIRSEQAYRDVWTAFDRDRLARLLFAELPDGTPVATLLLLRSGGTVTEPYGGATLAGGEQRANYLLKWEAMNRSREDGATAYDMWGLSSPGIAHFKAGFGGRELRYAGAWDLGLDPVGRGVLDAARRARIWASRVRHGLDPRRAVSADGAGGSEGPERPEGPDRPAVRPARESGTSGEEGAP